MTQHLPVLLTEVIGGLRLRPGDVVVDCTFGGGSYTRAFLDATAPNGMILALDCDPHAIDRGRHAPWVQAAGARVTLVHANFRQIADMAAAQGIAEAHGVVADLGLSSDQLADAHRGFSFGAPGPLDMRCDPTSTTPTAADLVRSLPSPAIERLLRTYGEEPRAYAIAQAIVAARRRGQIETTDALAALVERVAPRRGRIHPATRTFQALRIAVNDELGNLARAIPAMLTLLAPGGRCAIVSFHSLEDRIVKRMFRDAAIAGGYSVITRKPMVPSRSAIIRNARSRSAKLRIIERSTSMGPLQKSFSRHGHDVRANRATQTRAISGGSGERSRNAVEPNSMPVA